MNTASFRRRSPASATFDTVFLTKAVFGNTAGFPIVFGIPLTILMQEEFGFKPTA